MHATFYCGASVRGWILTRQCGTWFTKAICTILLGVGDFVIGRLIIRMFWEHRTQTLGGSQNAPTAKEIKIKIKQFRHLSLQ
jgi:hypothetical protein